ncbi:MAG: hypothetical protein NTX75_05525 [Proteobacteria bacterium]|nr:hypothetical protein [Pseudomonadota bacterium]
MPESPIFTIKIKNQQPVELVDLTNSFFSLADEYKRFIGQDVIQESGDIPEEIKLYIKEIRTGSIEADLVAYAAGMIPFLEHTKTVIEFGKYLKMAYDYLTGKSCSKPQLQKINYENLSAFVEPIAKDNASQINCQTIINGDVNVYLDINSLEANAAQNIAKREISLLREPIIGIKEKTLLYWYQARNDPKSQVGDKAIIESIQTNPTKTIFRNDNIKSQMIYGENPFKSAYIVDVQVETIQGKPVVYKILDIHERIDRSPEPSPDSSDTPIVQKPKRKFNFDT